MSPSRRVGSFIAGGVVIQAASAVAGLILARAMPVDGYAVYTVAMTVIGAIWVITRSGIQTAFAAELGKVWPDRSEAAAALSAALRSRLWISALTMPPILAASVYLLRQAGSQGWELWACAAILLLLWAADLRASLFDLVLYFDQQTGTVRLLDSVLAILRMFAVLALAAVQVVTLVPALLTTLFVTAGRVPLLQRRSRQLLGPELPAPDAALTRMVTRVAGRQVPTDVFFCFQSQLVLFYLAQAGSFELATYGALGRIAQLLAPFSTLTLAFFVPAFAGVVDRALPRMTGYVLLSSLPALALLGLALAAPQALLLVIGPAYAGRGAALAFCALGTTITLVAQCAWDLVSHRGWNEWSWLRIAWGVVWALGAPLLLPVHSAGGAYLFYAGFAAGMIVAAAMGLIGAQRRGEIALLGPRGGVAAVSAS
ncbi:MAG TPA: hypothetical protein VFP14_01185 [Novosphingobium sp.]|nr:hypothetical protein [Novosphingobium sp.]